MAMSSLQTFNEFEFEFEGQPIRRVEHSREAFAFDADDVLGVLRMDYTECPAILKPYLGYTVQDVIGLRYLTTDSFLDLMLRSKSQDAIQSWTSELEWFIEKHIYLMEAIERFILTVEEIERWRKLHESLANTPKPAESQKIRECDVSNALAKKLGGRREVRTPSGSVDVLTDSEVIEVKAAASWRNAVGQVLSYCQHYPDRTPRIHLFGLNAPNFNMADAKHVCSSLGITLTIEDESRSGG